MHDALTILAISIFAALVSEGISYLLIYRTEDYKKLKKAIEQLTAKGKQTSYNGTGKSEGRRGEEESVRSRI